MPFGLFHLSTVFARFRFVLNRPDKSGSLPLFLGKFSHALVHLLIERPVHEEDAFCNRPVRYFIRVGSGI